MSQPTSPQLKESIAELTAYRDRLHNEIRSMGEKLNLTNANIELTLKEHPDLPLIESTLKELEAQLIKSSK